jgi:prokaryotic ubiquitin-like protein Pup
MASEQQNKVNKVTEAGEEEYALAAKDAGLDFDIDDILDDIDDVLEENAEEFVKGYVQKGGQ